MRRPAVALLLFGAAFGSACPEPTQGPDVIDQPGPVLTHVFVRDETAQGGRNLVTDILDASAGAVAIGTPIQRGGNQIRLVFDRALDPALAAQIISSDAIVRLSRADGGDVATVRSYDGAATSSSTPAIVLVPNAPLAVKTTYRILLDNSRIKDTEGNVLRRDARGQVKTSYGFTTEGLYVLSASPDVSSPSTRVAPNAAIVLRTNADVDEASAAAGIGVSDARGRAVPIEVFAWRGSSPQSCAPQVDTRRIVIVPVSVPGTLAEWPQGELTLATTGVVDRDTQLTVLRAGASSTTFFGGTFRVMGARVERSDPTSSENFALPEDCGTPRPDAGVVEDTGVPVDTGVVTDTGVAPDTGARDATPTDTGRADAADAGRTDTGRFDAAARDAAPDAGVPDAPAPDAPAPDAAEPDAAEPPDTGEAPDTGELPDTGDTPDSGASD